MLLDDLLQPPAAREFLGVVLERDADVRAVSIALSAGSTVYELSPVERQVQAIVRTVVERVVTVTSLAP
ncbi:MAG: hypothetical protein R3A10_15360 [Caldilineaceae bacterium]